MFNRKDEGNDSVLVALEGRPAELVDSTAQLLAVWLTRRLGERDVVTVDLVTRSDSMFIIQVRPGHDPLDAPDSDEL